MNAKPITSAVGEDHDQPDDWHRQQPSGSTIIDNQMEKQREHEMETGPGVNPKPYNPITPGP